MHAAMSLVPAVVEALHFISSHEARCSLCGELACPNLTKPCHRKHNVQHYIYSHGGLCFRRTSWRMQLAVSSQPSPCLAPSISSKCRHTPSHLMQICAPYNCLPRLGRLRRAPSGVCKTNVIGHGLCLPRHLISAYIFNHTPKSFVM
jgi:hypothetical protein